MRSVPIIALALLVSAWQLHAKPLSDAEAGEFLTTVGFYTGAADACGYAKDASRTTHDFVDIAINKGDYGDPYDARKLYENARRAGIDAGARARKLEEDAFREGIIVEAKRGDCAQVGERMRAIVKALFPK